MRPRDDIPHAMPRLISSFREAGLRFSRDGCAFHAQALAFNALFALFPLVVLVLSGASYLFPHSQHRVLTLLATLSPALRSYVATNLQTYIYGRGISSLVALGFLIWSGKNLFMGLTYALDRALGVPRGRGLVHDMALSLVMLPIIGVCLILAMLLPVVISVAAMLAHLPDRQHLTQIGAYVISIGLVFVICMVLYTFLPNRELAWRFGVPGAIFATLLWPVLQFAFAQYTVHVNFAHIYGALSAPLVLLLWFYLVGSTFLFGAELCASWAYQHGNHALPAPQDQAA